MKKTFIIREKPNLQLNKKVANLEKNWGRKLVNYLI